MLNTTREVVGYRAFLIEFRLTSVDLVLAQATVKEVILIFLKRSVARAERIKGFKIVVNHIKLNTTREVVGYLAFLFAAAHSGPCLRAGSTCQLPASLYLILNILFKEAQDSFPIFAMLAKAR